MHFKDEIAIVYDRARVSGSLHCVHQEDICQALRIPPTHNFRMYRYFDCTEEATFLYSCVARAVDHDLPRELDYLRRHDEALRRIMDLVEMPDRMAENLIFYIRKNNGTLGRKRCESEFAKLTDTEVMSVEEIVHEAFDGYDEP